MTAAARGIAAITVGDRRAPSFFDFSARGLAGSFIAFLVATSLSAYLPLFTGDDEPALPSSLLVLIAAIPFLLQLGCTALVLRQLNRLDRFVPYLVADNWTSFYMTAVLILLSLMGSSSRLSLLLIGVPLFVIEINIARLVVGLRPWQIAMLLVARLVGAAIGLVLIEMIVPLPAGA